MEDTISDKERFRGQSLPITFKERDYHIRVLHKTVTRADREIKILLDGTVQTLVPGDNHWKFSETDENGDFAQSIRNAISLRYRL